MGLHRALTRGCQDKAQLDIRQHSHGVPALAWAQWGTGPRGRGSRDPPPAPVAHLGLAPQVQLSELGEGQVGELVQAH